MHTLYFMGQEDHEDPVRCRIYGGGDDADDQRRVAFVTALAGRGVIDCPAYDDWVAALQARGWLPPTPDLEPNPDGPGKIGRWLLTPKGREEWARIQGA